MPNTPDGSAATGIVDNLFAPEVFADLVAGVFLDHGNAHITFTSRRADNSTNPATMRGVVVGRLVMPFERAENMVQFLGDWVSRMKAQHAAPDTDGPKTIQ